MTSSFVGLLSAARPPPLVDVDATVFVQFAIFLLLLIVLTRFVFKPFLALRAERAQKIEGAKEEAQKLAADAATRLARYEERILAARKEAGSARLAGRKESEAAAAAKLAEVRRSSDTTLGAAREKLEKSVQASQLALRARADVIARVAVAKLLGREV
jgi:F-type H+-transporting ATPase subunit b